MRKPIGCSRVRCAVRGASEIQTMKRISRRGFLNGAGAALGAAVVPSSVLGRDGAISPGDRITVACIGAGWQGGRTCRASSRNRRRRSWPLATSIPNTWRPRGRPSTRSTATRTARRTVYSKKCWRAGYRCGDAGGRRITGTGSSARPPLRAGKDIYGEKPLARISPRDRRSSRPSSATDGSGRREAGSGRGTTSASPANWCATAVSARSQGPRSCCPAG